MQHKTYIRNIGLDLVLTVLMCGLWNLVVQDAQMQALNQILKTEKYALWKLIVFSLLTCGLYAIYNEYSKAKDLAAITSRDETTEILLALVLTMIGMHWVYDAIFQDRLNDYLKSTNGSL